MSHSLEVAVIGSGVAGLVAARELRREAHRVVIFEKSDRVGGLWVYDPRVEPDPMSQDPGREMVHSSVYESLRTNLPRALMGFSDFDFEERKYGDPREFPGHREVLEFLKDFATRFGIVELVRFNSEVERVERVDERPDRWRVEWKEGRVKLEMHVFDAVLVCNGHCTVPRLADIPGIEKWPGKQMHSHNYRVPAPFKDQVVVVIGNGASAYDISREIAKVAKEVHLSSRSPLAKSSKLDHYHNMWQHSSIYMAKEDGTVEFEDKSSVQASVILHCTGYKYEFPFLNTNGIINVDNNRVDPLYKHVFPPKLAPRLAFVDLPQKAIIFRMIELQSKWIARVLSGKAKLPTEEEMMDDVNQYYQQMKMSNTPIHLTHFLSNLDEYLDYLVEQAGAMPLEDWRKQIYKKVIRCVENHQDGFRDDLDFS